MGETQDGNVSIRVHRIGDKPEKPDVAATDGFVQNDSVLVGAWRSKLINVKRNDEGYKEDGYQITAINGKPIKAGEAVEVDDGNDAAHFGLIDAGGSGIVRRVFDIKILAPSHHLWRLSWP